MWNDLTMQQRADVISMAVKSGLRDMTSIRNFYDESVKGSGREYEEGGYLDWKRKASRYKHLDIDNDNTYDYEGWYNENPKRAWLFLKDSPDAHFSDRYKTVYHPTFSTQSKYSGVINARFNPQGLKGGTWSEDNRVFTMSPDGYRGPVSMDERRWYLENAEVNGVQLREADGSLPIYDGVLWGGVLPQVTVIGKKRALGGYLFETGGPIYDESVKRSRRFGDGGPKPVTTSGAGYIPPRDYTPITYTPQQQEEFDRAEKQIRDMLSWVPYVGTALDVDEAAHDPSIGNTLWAGASVGLDILSLGLLSRAAKRIGKAEKALEGAMSTTREAEKRYNTARKVFEQAPSNKNYRTLSKREREMWDAQSKTRKTGWGEAFDGSLQRELEQEKQQYNVYNILTGMGGAETNGLQLILEGE